MSVPTPFTTSARILQLAGQLAIDLRSDDTTEAASIAAAVDVGTADADFYLSVYSLAGLAADEWVADCATFFGVRYLCFRRLNELPASIQKECERREKQLDLVAQGKRRLRIAKTRRPAVVTNYCDDLRRYNNQIRVDTARSTGVAKNYVRPTDPTAPNDA